MKFNLGKCAVAAAVLVAMAGSFAEAAPKTTRGGPSTQDSKKSAQATAKQSKSQQGDSSTAQPAQGANRRARTGFGADQQAPAAQKKATSKQAKTASALAALVSDLNAINSGAGLTEAVLSKNVELAATAKEIVATAKAKQNDPEAAAIAKERVAGLAIIAKLGADVRNLETEFNPAMQKTQMLEQSYVALVRAAGKEASSWEDSQQKAALLLLQVTNEKISQGNSVADSIAAAQLVVKNQLGKDVTLADLKRLCKVG